MDCWAVNGVLREHGEWLKLPRFGGVSGNEAIKSFMMLSCLPKTPGGGQNSFMFWCLLK